MDTKIVLTLFTVGIFTAAGLFASCTASAAQKPQVRRAAPAPRIAQPRFVAPRRAAPRIVAPRRTAPRIVVQPKAIPKVVSPATGGQKVLSHTGTPRIVTPHGTRAVTASRLRGVPAHGAGRTVIRGQNYSAWRGGYRIRHGGGWRTFVALSALSAIIIGSSEYYPYAYISAPEPYCEGLTEDGCELMWQDVQTLEGDVINQCVAYCPWQ